MFRYNLPPALLAEWPGPFTCNVVTQRVERITVFMLMVIATICSRRWKEKRTVGRKEWRMNEWMNGWMEEGKKEGSKEGIKEGRQKGRKEGKKEARKEGRREWMNAGMNEWINEWSKEGKNFSFTPSQPGRLYQGNRGGDRVTLGFGRLGGS